MLRRRAAVSAAALATGALLASASAASAAKIEVIDGTAVFSAAGGERNDVRAVTRFPVDQLTVSDSGARLRAGAGCTQLDEHTATCAEDPEAPRPLVVSTRDRGDNVLVDDDEFREVTVRSGSGDDTVDVGSATGSSPLLVGGDGDDELSTRMNSAGAHPILKGDDGNDVLGLFEVGGGEAYGGDGNDRITYGAASFGRPVLLDGGDGNDRYTFTQQFIATAMVAGRGFDTLDEGGPLAPFAGIVFDMSVCSGCVDRVIGTANSDTITGDGRTQAILGGDGDDVIDGGGGPDLLAGEGGNDTITSLDGTIDAVSCGADLDTVTADAFDLVSRDCETVS